MADERLGEVQKGSSRRLPYRSLRGPQSRSRRDPLSMIEELCEMAQVLAEADPKDKAEVYSALGIEVVYRPDLGILAVTSRPLAGGQQSVSEGGLEPPRPFGH